jgi:hypothetical protein
MRSNLQASSKNSKRLFHISEEPGIKIFEPRPSPSFFAEIKGDVVFAIEESLLHNYLLPRDCPRVTWYRAENTTPEDEAKFFGESAADFVVIVESGWYWRIKETKLYRYELPAEHFTLLDECAGYYISYRPVITVAVEPVGDIITELLSRNVELRFTPSLIKIAETVKQSSLNYSIIRMRNGVGYQ